MIPAFGYGSKTPADRYARYMFIDAERCHRWSQLGRMQDEWMVSVIAWFNMACDHDRQWSELTLEPSSDYMVSHGLGIWN